MEAPNKLPFRFYVTIIVKETMWLAREKWIWMPSDVGQSCLFQRMKVWKKFWRAVCQPKPIMQISPRNLFGFPHSKGYGHKLRSAQNSFQVVDLSTQGCCCYLSKSYGPIMVYHYFIWKVHLFVEIATPKKGKREFNKSLENGFKNSLKRLQDCLSVQVTLSA